MYQQHRNQDDLLFDTVTAPDLYLPAGSRGPQRGARVALAHKDDVLRLHLCKDVVHGRRPLPRVVRHTSP